MVIKIDNGYQLKQYMKQCNSDYFSEQACESLLEIYDEDCECDPVAIRCDWDEYGTGCAMRLDDLLYDYGYLAKCGGWSYLQVKGMSADEKEQAVEEVFAEVEDRTTALRLSNGNVLIMAF